LQCHKSGSAFHPLATRFWPFSRLPFLAKNILSLALTSDGLLLSRPAEAPKQLAFLACFLTASRMQNIFATRAADVWVVDGGWHGAAIAANGGLLHICVAIARQWHVCT